MQQMQAMQQAAMMQQQPMQSFAIMNENHEDVSGFDHFYSEWHADIVRKVLYPLAVKNDTGPEATSLLLLIICYDFMNFKY